MRQRDELDAQVGAVKSFAQQLSDNVELIALGEAEGDAEIVKEAEGAIEELQQTASRLQVETLLSGEADHNDCYLEIHAGAGGTESQDWASMLLRMYTRWAERRKFKVDTMEIHPGEEAGIKSATIQIKGHNAYGWLKTEAGVHRLVRISPYDSAARRHSCEPGDCYWCTAAKARTKAGHRLALRRPVPGSTVTRGRGVRWRPEDRRIGRGRGALRQRTSARSTCREARPRSRPSSSPR